MQLFFSHTGTTVKVAPMQVEATVAFSCRCPPAHCGTAASPLSAAAVADPPAAHEVTSLSFSAMAAAPPVSALKASRPI